MNEIVQKMLTRHAIRRFEDRQIEEDALEQILQAGLYAPSAGNNQYSRIVVCQDKEVNEKLGRKLSTPISNGGLIFTAPLRYAGSAPWAGFTDTIHAGCLLSGGHLSFEFIIFFLVSNIFPNRFLVHIADCCNVISSCPEMLISSFCSKLWMSVKQHQRTFTFQVRHEI